MKNKLISKPPTKILLGLSGGVDSAVAAILLKKQGYQVETAYIECWSEPGCRAEGDRRDALQIALKYWTSKNLIGKK